MSPLGPKIQEMSHLQHLKWSMKGRTPFILSLYGVAGVLIEYSFHKCGPTMGKSETLRHVPRMGGSYRLVVVGGGVNRNF